jgi:hypothetical protein
MASPRSLEVFLRGVLPSTHLSPNRGERKEGRAAYAISGAKMQMRGDVARALLSEAQVRNITEPFDPCEMHLTLRWYKRASDGFYRPMDWGNAAYALKAAIDGVIDAGLIVDDDYKHVVRGSCAVQRCATYQDEGLVIWLEEVE